MSLNKSGDDLWGVWKKKILNFKEAFVPVWQEKVPKATQGSVQCCRYHHPFDLKRQILLWEGPWRCALLKQIEFDPRKITHEATRVWTLARRRKNIGKEKKDLPKDSDISRLFLGEEQDPKSKFKSGGSDHTLEIVKIIAFWRVWAGAWGCLSSTGWWWETPLEFSHYKRNCPVPG